MWAQLFLQVAPVPLNRETKTWLQEVTDHCYWNVIASRSFQWTELGNMRYFFLNHQFIQITSIYIPVSQRSSPLLLPFYICISLLPEQKFCFPAHQYLYSPVLTSPSLSWYYTNTTTLVSLSKLQNFFEIIFVLRIYLTKGYTLKVLCLNITWILFFKYPVRIICFCFIQYEGFFFIFSDVSFPFLSHLSYSHQSSIGWKTFNIGLTSEPCKCFP